MKLLCDYSIFPSSWKTNDDGNDDDATSKCWSSQPSPLLSGSELAASTHTVATATATATTTTTMTASMADAASSPLMMPPATENPNFVNVYMVVDPTQQTVTFPKQIVTYKTGGVVSTAVAGPFVIGDQQLQALFQVAQTMTNSTNAASNSSCSCSLPDTAPPSAPLFPPVTFSADAAQKTLKSLNYLNITNNTALPPVRPLSAYNFFFRDERDRILNEDREHDWSMAKQQKLLQDHWGRDRNAKRRHRKTHGKIDFTTLSRLISTRWKKLAAHHQDFYRQMAAMDFERYQRETTNQLLPSPNSSSFMNDYAAVVA